MNPAKKKPLPVIYVYKTWLGHDQMYHITEPINTFSFYCKHCDQRSEEGRRKKVRSSVQIPFWNRWVLEPSQRHLHHHHLWSSKILRSSTIVQHIIWPVWRKTQRGTDGVLDLPQAKFFTQSTWNAERVSICDFFQWADEEPCGKRKAWLTGEVYVGGQAPNPRGFEVTPWHVMQDKMEGGHHNQNEYG